MSTYDSDPLASAPDRETACRLARSLPRPNAVRRHGDGTWVVVRLVPSSWRPPRPPTGASAVTSLETGPATPAA